MIITNSHYALVGYFITSYPTRAHGIIVIYLQVTNLIKLKLSLKLYLYTLVLFRLNGVPSGYMEGDI